MNSLSERVSGMSPIVYNAGVRPVIILFAKAPVSGNVKTRLIPALSSNEAADLHRAFVSDLLLRFEDLHWADLELHTDSDTDAWPTVEVPRKLQISGSLGLRMLHSLEQAMRAGRPSATIVGADAPTLPADYLEQLVNASSDVALGPTDDGGFYAIRARRTDPKMFDGVTWSRTDTLQRTIEALGACGLTVSVGPGWFDVDAPADLERLRACPDLPPHTTAWFSRRGLATRRTGTS